MVVKALVGLGLLSSAFSPLFLVLVLVVNPLPGTVLNVGLAVASAAPCVLLITVLRITRQVQAYDLDTRHVRHRDVEVLSFLASFIVPIGLAFFAADTSDLAAAAVFLVVLSVVYVRGGLYHLNPVLLMMGYRLYEVTKSSEEVVMVLSRSRHIPQRGRLRAHRLADDVYVEGPQR